MNSVVVFLKFFTCVLLSRPFGISPFDKTKLSYNTPRQRNTTASLENYPCIHWSSPDRCNHKHYTLAAVSFYLGKHFCLKSFKATTVKSVLNISALNGNLIINKVRPNNFFCPVFCDLRVNVTCYSLFNRSDLF